jgi:predicted metal-dependent phosphotriesterase family hydrolase
VSDLTVIDWESEEGHDAICEIRNAAWRADASLKREGGTTRHWVRDHFIPELEAAGFTIVRKPVA